MNEYNIGYLNGILNAFAHINNGNYRAYDFGLKSLPNDKSLKDSLQDQFYDYSEVFDLNIIKENHWNFLKEILLDQLFDYQHNHNPIIDSSKSYSLFDRSFQEDFVLDFLNTLYYSSDVKNIYKLELKNLKKHYAVSSLNIIIEMEDKTNFILHFSSHD